MSKTTQRTRSAYQQGRIDAKSGRSVRYHRRFRFYGAYAHGYNQVEILKRMILKSKEPGFINRMFNLAGGKKRG